MDLHLDEAELGALGSLVYAGNAMGSLAAPIVFSKFKPKWIVITCMILNAICLLVFPATDIYWLICISRVGVGIFQVREFIITYLI